MPKLKHIGIIMTIAGTLFGSLSIVDLFGAQRAPKELTVTFMLIGIAMAFLGPAIAIFHLPTERRKKITRNSFIISVTLIVLGLLSVYMHWLGARVEIILGVLIICFFYGALSFRSKYEKWKIYASSKFDAFFLSLFDFIGIGMIVLGFLFRIQHWPLGDVFIVFGMITLAIGVLAWNQKFKREVVRRKETEDKLKISLEEIATQHDLLEEKQKEIIASITYAKRIQRSHLPTEKYIDQNLKRLNK